MCLLKNKMEDKRVYTVGIITASDKGSKGEREDVSGAVMQEILKENGYDVKEYRIIADEQALLEEAMKEMADEKKVNLILTTGGTGFSMRDRTPEATLAVCDRLAPGIPEAMRAYSMQITNRAMLSRAVAGIRNQTLIINMPGSPKAVKESLECILDALSHGLAILAGDTGECAR